jgi:hypothetical protein
MERGKRVRFWILVASNSGAMLCEAGWRYRLGDLTGAFERYLDDTGLPAESYPPLYRGEPDYALRPSPDGKYSVDPLSGAHDTGDMPRGCTDKEEELFARRFDPEEVLGKRLAVDRLLCDACEALGVLPGVQTCGERFYRLGIRARKNVFLYLGGGAGSSESLTAHLASADSNIELYVAQRTAEVEACGMLADVDVVEIGAHLDIGKDGGFINIEHETERNAEREGVPGCAGTGMNIAKAGFLLEYGGKAYSFKGEKRWEMVMKLIGAKGKYIRLGKGIKALFASNEQAKAFFDAAVEAEGQGINGTGRYRLKI